MSAAGPRPILVAPPRLATGPIQGGITTRIGFPPATRAGDEDPSRETGRALLARLIHHSPQQMAWLRQVHGASVKVTREGGFAGEADALVSDVAGLVLLVAVADCGPVLLRDAKAGVIGAAHAGWRGAVAGICEETVAAMIGIGAHPDRIEAWVGPCIGPQNFEVGEEVAGRFGDCFVLRNRARPHVDLPGAIRARLLDAGLGEGHIEVAHQCTVDLADRYWSYRRDGGICGRQLAWIVREGAQPVRT